jgi:hypothetical protein
MKAFLLALILQWVPAPGQVLGPAPAITIHTEGVATITAEGRELAIDQAEVSALSQAAHRLFAMRKVMLIVREYDLCDVIEEPWTRTGDQIHIRLTTRWTEK